VELFRAAVPRVPSVPVLQHAANHEAELAAAAEAAAAAEKKAAEDALKARKAASKGKK